MSIEFRDGVPVIAGTGFKVAILGAIHRYGSVSMEWIAENYDLTLAQIQAGLTYYYNQVEELDNWIQEGNELAKQIGVSSQEVIERMRQRKNKDKSDDQSSGMTDR